jgi:beta-lactamase class A
VPLEQAVQAALVGTRGSYGVAVRNLKTQENYLFNEHLSYYSASLYKLWIMAEAYRQIKDGVLKEDEILSEEYKTLNAKFNINPESAKFKEGKITLSVGDALNKMITISDNYAAFLLSLKVRLTNVTAFLKMNGFSESTVGADGDAPTTTAYDIALFFEKLYNKQLVSEEYSDKMLALLKAQKLNDKIPKFLPDYIITAHKTGELNEFTHDGGIVYLENNEYIIVVLSKSDDPKLAKNRISNVSESVYNYFTTIQSEQTPEPPIQ